MDLLRVCGLEPRTSGRDSRRAVASQLRARGNVYLGAFDRERLVGAILGTHDTRKGWINRLAVHPDYRRRRIASRLVGAAEKGLRVQGMRMFAALVVPGNEASEAFFRARGYDILTMIYARKKDREAV